MYIEPKHAMTEAYLRFWSVVQWKNRRSCSRYAPPPTLISDSKHFLDSELNSTFSVFISSSDKFFFSFLKKATSKVRKFLCERRPWYFPLWYVQYNIHTWRRQASSLLPNRRRHRSRLQKQGGLVCTYIDWLVSNDSFFFWCRDMATNWSKGFAWCGLHWGHIIWGSTLVLTVRPLPSRIRCMSKLRQDERITQNAGVYWMAQSNRRQRAGAAEASTAASSVCSQRVSCDCDSTRIRANRPVEHDVCMYDMYSTVLQPQ